MVINKEKLVAIIKDFHANDLPKTKPKKIE